MCKSYFILLVLRPQLIHIDLVYIRIFYQQQVIIVQSKTLKML